MMVKLKIEELDVFKSLPEEHKASVIKEYKKGYHALLFHGKLIVAFIALLAMGYLNRELKLVFWGYRLIIYVTLGHLFFLIIDFIEINLVAKKVIKDLAKDLQDTQ